MSQFERLMATMAYVATHGRELQEVCHQAAVKSGWWTNLQTDQLFSVREVDAMVPQKLLLIHSEISEACEAHRKGLKDDKIPDRDGLEIELADALIRIYDLAGALGYDMGTAMAAKMQYNATRKDHSVAHRKAAGGKSY